MKKILSFAATNSRNSINKQLVTHAGQLLVGRLSPGAELDVLDLNDFEMPIYSIDRENDSGIPAAAHRFFDKVRAADAILIAFAEHNGSYSVAFKNVFDWASRIEMRLFENKPMVLMATSPGPNGGRNVLQIAVDAMPHFGADVRGGFSLGSFHDHVDPKSGLALDETYHSELMYLIDDLAALQQTGVSADMEGAE